MLERILVFLLGFFFVFLMFRTIRNNPGLLNKENLNASFRTMGILALILIAAVGIVVFFLRR